MAPLATIRRYDVVTAPPGPGRRRKPRWSQAASPVPLLDIQALKTQLDRVVESGRPVVRASAIARAAAGMAALPAGALALTFDGSLADHHDLVLPLLLDRDLTATFFLAPAAIVGGRVMEAHKIHFLLAAAEDEDDVIAAIYDVLAERRHTSTAPSFGKPPWQEQIADPATKRRIEAAFVTRLLRSALPAGLRTAIIRRLFRTYVTSAEHSFAARLYLSPAQVQALAESGMELGGCGNSGINLQGVPRRQQAEEIEASAGFLREQPATGDDGERLFAYPGGGWDEVTLDLLPRYGFTAAFTLHPGAVAAPSDPFRLPRYDATADFDTALNP